MVEDVQRTWRGWFASHRRLYVDTPFVLFRDAVYTGCGLSAPATGSFYCPTDRRTYIDLGAYEALRARTGEHGGRIGDGSGRIGDLAQRYVIAHEIAHHVQVLLAADPELTPRELQADCLAGISWRSLAARAAVVRGEIEDVQTALLSGDTHARSAATHGSPAQRMCAFIVGFETGDLSSCGLDLRSR